MSGIQDLLNSWERTIDADFRDLYPKVILVMLAAESSRQTGSTGKHNQQHLV